MSDKSNLASWSVGIDEIADLFQLDLFQLDLDRGHTSEQADEQHEKDGPNQLSVAPGRTPLQIFGHQFVDLMIVLLVVAGLISALIGEWSDSILIAIIVLANAVIGVGRNFQLPSIASETHFFLFIFW